MLTPRLELVPGTLAVLDAELVGPAELATTLAARVPSDWPPGEHDLDAVGFFRERLLAEGEGMAGWYAWYARTRDNPTLVGAAGYFGPPGDSGQVEIGYSVCTECRRQGYAREMVEAIVARAFARADVQRVIAHTAPQNHASIGLLVVLGFVPMESQRPEHLGFVLKRPA